MKGKGSRMIRATTNPDGDGCQCEEEGKEYKRGVKKWNRGNGGKARNSGKMKRKSRE